MAAMWESDREQQGPSRRRRGIRLTLSIVALLVIGAVAWHSWADAGERLRAATRIAICWRGISTSTACCCGVSTCCPAGRPRTASRL